KGTDVFIGGAGSDVINGGAGNDLGIYALSDHYVVVNNGTALQSISNDIDHYYGNGGTNTLRIVATADEYALVYKQLYAYQQWAALYGNTNQTYSFTFGTNAVGLVVSGWQKFVIELVSTNPVQGADLTHNATGSVTSL